MADRQERVLGRSGGIDPAALAAAALAAAISSIAPPGPYSPTSTMIGVTILVLIISYDEDPHRTIRQSIAFGAVCALISLLVLGYPLEYIFAKDKDVRLGILFHEREKDIKYSEIPPGVVIALWVGLACLYSWLDSRRPSNVAVASKASSTSPTPEAPSS